MLEFLGILFISICAGTIVVFSMMLIRDRLWQTEEYEIMGVGTMYPSWTSELADERVRLAQEKMQEELMRAQYAAALNAVSQQTVACTSTGHDMYGGFTQSQPEKSAEWAMKKMKIYADMQAQGLGQYLSPEEMQRQFNLLQAGARRPVISKEIDEMADYLDGIHKVMGEEN